MPERKWTEIATILNSIPGTQKDWKQWRKTWQDIRSKTKKRKSEQTKHIKGTGGGPSVPDLTAVDEQVLSMISQEAIHGNENIEETSISFDYGNKDSQDHDYVKMDYSTTVETISEDTVIETPLEENEKTKYNSHTTPQKEIYKRKRMTPSSRLKDSVEATRNLVENSNKKLEMKQVYYDKKLLLLERQTLALENLVDVLKYQNRTIDLDE